MQQKRVVLHLFLWRKICHQSCGKTILCCGENAFIRTSVNKRVSVAIYNLFILPVISRLIDACIIKSTVCNLCQKPILELAIICTCFACVSTLRLFQHHYFCHLIQNEL